MTYSTPTPTDLGTFLGQAVVDQARAIQLIAWAEILCKSYVSPLPDGAQVTVITVAARGFTSTQAATPEVYGPYGTPAGLPSAGGIWIGRNDIRTLRRMAGYSGAFTIDTAPQTAPPLPWWETGASGILPGDVGWGTD